MPIPAAIGGALIGGASNILGGIFGNKARRKAQNKAFDQTKQMFDYQNAYNTPANQVKRLKDAGLNPALMYGQGTTGNSIDYPKMQAAQQESVGVNAAQSAAAGAQLSLLNSHKALNEANAIKAGIEGSVKAGEFGIAKEMSKYQMDKLSAETRGINATNEYKVLELNRAKVTGMIKGDNWGNIAKALDVEINTADGKSKFKNILYGIIAGSAALKLAPSILSLLGRKGITKGMSQDAFNKAADKWLNTPFKN